jgi:hypothetical protein
MKTVRRKHAYTKHTQYLVRLIDDQRHFVKSSEGVQHAAQDSWRSNDLATSLFGCNCRHAFRIRHGDTVDHLELIPVQVYVKLEGQVEVVCRLWESKLLQVYAKEDLPKGSRRNCVCKSNYFRLCDPL